MKLSLPLLLLTTAFFLSACTPHPASGVWKATEDNEYGTSRLVVGFDGKANFLTSKMDNTI